MQVHEFDTASLPDTPWKNGLGRTRELACWPAGSSLGAFDWRVSIATIGASAPFSRFDGIDRTIMLLSGPGVRLSSADGTLDQRLDRPCRPFSFAGELALEGEPLGGESRDFNVMTRRAAYRSETAVVRAAEMMQPAPFGLLLALNGAWQATCGATTRRLRPDAGLWWEGAAEEPWALLPASEAAGPGATLVAVRWFVTVLLPPGD
jgi:hypothetical protein